MPACLAPTPSDTSAPDAGAAGDASPPDGDVGDDAGPPPVSSFARAALKTKSGARLLTDLSDSLALPRGDVCRELDSVDCLQVHGISLLEVEPRFLRIQSPIENLISGVIASDRIALLACANRVDADLNGEAGPPLVPELSSGLEQTTTRAAVVDRLARRLVRRPATDNELQQLTNAYDDLPAADRDRAWVTLTCFALATLTENLFY